MAEPFRRQPQMRTLTCSERLLGEKCLVSAVAPAPALSLKPVDGAASRVLTTRRSPWRRAVASAISASISLCVRWRQSLQLFVQERDKRAEWFIECSTEAPQLNDIDPALAAFRLTYIRLRLTKAFCKLNLGHSVCQANVAQDRKKCLVLPRMYGLAHGSQAIGQPCTLETILE